MKSHIPRLIRTIFFVLPFVIGTQLAFADSTTNGQQPSVTTSQQAAPAAAAPQTATGTVATNPSANAAPAVAVTQSTAPKQLTGAQTVLTYLPAFIYFFIVLLILFWMKKSKVSLKKLLLDKDMQVSLKAEETKQQVARTNAYTAQANAIAAHANASAAAGVAPQIVALPQVPAPAVPAPMAGGGAADADPTTEDTQSSISRLLAFISGLVSLGLAASITSYVMYCSFTNVPVDLGKLTQVLWGMGLGVIPYGFNKVAAALK